MIEIHSQNLRASDRWEAAPTRAAGLYGELQPLPVPVAGSVSSASARKPRTRTASTD